MYGVRRAEFITEYDCFMYVLATVEQRGRHGSGDFLWVR